MNVAGLTISPIELHSVLSKTRIKFSVNEVTQSLVLILGLQNFARLKPQITKQKCLIFDTQERLQSLIGLPILNDKNPAHLLDKIKALKPANLRGINNRNYIVEYLENNKDKDGGFLHIYNTNLYKITHKPTRDAVRILFLSLLNSSCPRGYFDKEIKKIMPKKGKALTAAECLVELVDTDSFKNMQECIQKAKKAKNDKEIEKLAASYDIAAFDIRYLLSNLKQT